MHTLLIIVRCLLLIFSLYGYAQLIYSRYALRVAFIPAVLFSGIGSLMFLAGILNLLPETAWAILAGGLGLGAWAAWKKLPFRPFCSFATLFFAGMTVYFVLLLFGDRFLEFDNFSHWAIAPKVMLQQDRFPNFSDALITYQSYPLGTASLIYFFVRITGVQSEWMYMYAQAMLLLGYGLCLFAFVPAWREGKRAAVCNLAAAAACLLLIAGWNNFYDLMVDTALSLAGFAGVALCYAYQTSPEKTVPPPAILLPIPVFLVAIKNSGVFFSLVIIVYYAVCVVRARAPWRNVAWVAAGPLACLLLWQKHVELVFENGLLARHSMSVEGFRQQFASLDEASILKIIRDIMDRVFSLSNRFVYLLIFILILFALRWLFRGRYRSITPLCVISVLSYVVYVIGLCGLYLFSMPPSYAAILSGYNRYHYTVLLFIGGLLFIAVQQVLRETPVTSARRGLACAAVVSLLSLVLFDYTLQPFLSQYVKKQDLSGTLRQTCESRIAEYDIPPGASYLLLIPELDDYYSYYILRYLLDTDQIAVYTDDTLPEIGERWREHQYLIVLERSDRNARYVFDRFGVGDCDVLALDGYK